MARKPYRVPAQVVRKWTVYANHRRAEGFSLWKIAQEISGDYDWRTVYLYLNPEARERANRSSLRAYHRKARRQRERISYARVYRNPESFLDSIFTSSDALSIHEIVEELSEAERVSFSSKAIQRLLSRYIRQSRGPPYLEESEPGVYRRLNQPNDAHAAEEFQRRRDERRETRRTYERNYRRITSNPERYLTVIFEDHDELDLDDITDRLTSQTEGVQYRLRTVRNLLQRYIHEARGPPYLEEIEPGVYRRIDQPESD